MASLQDQVLPAPPSGTNHLVVIRQDITILLMITMFASFCVPMLLALFFFSSHHKCRRTPIFYLNVSVLLLGIVQAAYCVGVITYNLLHPSNELSQGFLLFYYALSFFTPILVEIVLIFRLAAVFTHPKYHGKRAYIVGFSAFMKVVRLVVAILSLVFWYKGSQSRGVTLSSGLFGWNLLPYPRIGWGLQVIDNGYCSLAFLFQLRKRIKDPGGIFRNGDLLRRLRGIFFLALSNFVVPCLLSLIHLVLALLDANWDPVPWFYNCNYIMIVNNYMSIIGVVFATIWATSIEWATVRGMCGCGGEIDWDVSFASSSTVGSSPLRPSSASTKVMPSTPDSAGSFKKGDYHYPGYRPNAAAQDDGIKPIDARRHLVLPPIPLQIRVEQERKVIYEIEVQGDEPDTSARRTPDSLKTIPEDGILQ